jgi:hypothetical protein
MPVITNMAVGILLIAYGVILLLGNKPTFLKWSGIFRAGRLVRWLANDKAFPTHRRYAAGAGLAGIGTVLVVATLIAWATHKGARLFY